jgi:uncharacterized phage protein gp47/JayE
MPVAPSFQDLLDVGQAEAQARRPDLTYYEGDITVAQNHGAAAMVDALIRLAAQLYKATFIDGASGDDLTALVDDHLNIQRVAGSQAQATVAFTRTSGGAGGTIPAGATIATEFDSDGETVEFTTDSAIIVPAAGNGPFNIGVTAVLAGPDGNVAASTITRIVDTLFDDTFSVTNAAVAAGGNNEESDPVLRERARSFFATLRRGTLAALEYGAKEVPSVVVATATEDTETGEVTVRVADGDGNSSAQMIADVEEELEFWRCAGIDVTVLGGTQVLVDMAITLDDVTSGFDISEAEAVIVDAVETRIARLDPGETLFLDSIIAQVIAVYPDNINDVGFSTITLTPGGAQPIQDVVPSGAQVLRAGTITVS